MTTDEPTVATKVGVFLVDAIEEMAKLRAFDEVEPETRQEFERLQSLAVGDWRIGDVHTSPVEFTAQVAVLIALRMRDALAQFTTKADADLTLLAALEAIRGTMHGEPTTAPDYPNG